ncbi:MAG: AhpC/TSA family protein [Proteobacteria bacterium]|nr:AhpC/TSA family protein [Pseudomonadota bacterium]
MRDRKNELSTKNIKVVVVTFEASSLARRYMEETRLDWPLIVDTNRDIYRAYGMLDASFWDIWGPSTWLAYLKEILRGQLPKRPSNDIRQRGGDVLIDPKGFVRLHHIGTGPADRPKVDAILQAIC